MKDNEPTRHKIEIDIEVTNPTMPKVNKTRNLLRSLFGYISVLSLCVSLVCLIIDRVEFFVYALCSFFLFFILWLIFLIYGHEDELDFFRGKKYPFPFDFD